MENQTDISQVRRNLSRIGWSMCLMLVVTAVIQIAVVQFASYPVLFAIQTNSWIRYALLIVPQYLVAMPLAAYLLRGQRPEIPAKTLDARQFRIIICIVYFLIYAGNIIGRIVTTIISAIAGSNMSNAVSTLVTGSDLLPRFVVLVLIAPVAEEIFFRKLLIEKLLPYGERVAVITSGLIFGLVHGNFSQFFYAFALGLALGYIYIKTGNLTYTILLHMAVNLMGSIVGPAVINAGTLLMSAFGLFMLTVAIAGLTLMIKYHKQIRFKSGQIALPNWRVVFLNAGMILFFAVCAAVFAISTYSSLT